MFTGGGGTIWGLTHCHFVFLVFLFFPFASFPDCALGALPEPGAGPAAGAAPHRAPEKVLPAVLPLGEGKGLSPDAGGFNPDGRMLGDWDNRWEVFHPQMSSGMGEFQQQMLTPDEF